MAAIDSHPNKYKQFKQCTTMITKTNIKRIFLRGSIGGGLACMFGYVGVELADTGGVYWVGCAGLADGRASGIYTAVYIQDPAITYCNKSLFIL